MPEGRPEDSLADTSPARSKLRLTLARLAARLAADQRGATSIEYAMIASGVAAVIAATVFGFGSTLKTTFYDKLASMFP
jgi:pilus assembly protein Flp/PilA